MPVLLPNYTSHRLIVWRVYHQRLGSSSVVYHSVALSRHRSAVPPLRRSDAPSLRCRGGALPRAAPLQGPERAERKRGATQQKRRRHRVETEAPHSRNGGGTDQKRRRHTAETGKQILKTQSGFLLHQR